MKKISLSSFIGVGAMLVATMGVVQAGPVYIDPEKAKENPDFLIQGEYEGEGWGAQVAARGEGQFDGFLLEGGLPGRGWDEKKRQEFSGRTEDDVTILEGEGEMRLKIKDGVMAVMRGDERQMLLERKDPVSPTLGLEPPEGAVVLYSGPDDADKWQDPEIDENGWLKEGVRPKQAFGDHRIHLEYLIPFMPEARGQGRGNSGVYLQGRYELQMLDSFADEPHDSHNGGIYSVAPPKLNPSYPPLVWQTYDIEFTAARYDEEGNKTENARITAKLNGVLIHEDAEVPGRTTASPDEEGPEAKPMYLQRHGSPVRYRNIWVVEKE